MNIFRAVCVGTLIVLGPCVFGGSIEGTVTRLDDAEPLVGINVDAFMLEDEEWGGWWYQVEGVMSGINGHYTLSGLNEGTYRIRFRDTTGGYVWEIFDGYQVRNPDEGGDNLVLGASDTITGIDAALTVGGRITGTVTESVGGTPLQSIYVTAYLSSGSWWDEVASTYTGVDGTYSIGGLKEGTYRVRFLDWSNEYVPEIYDGVQVSWPDDGGDNIWVPASTTVSNINAALTVGARITGTVTGPDGVTPLQDVGVAAYRWINNYWNSVAWDSTDALGLYELPALPEGSYRVRFADYSGTYLSEMYDGVVVEGPWDGGDNIWVPAASVVSNINASLGVASKIIGRVTMSDGVTPLADIDVTVYRWTGAWWSSISWDSTDSEGYYEADGLPEGTYRVGFFDWSYDLYAEEYYDDAGNLEAAADVYVPPESVVSNINANLKAYASISGTVTQSDGVTPIQGVQVQIHQDWRSGLTDASGDYHIGQLRPGTYALRAEPLHSTGFLSEWYDGVLFIADEWWWDQPAPPEATLVTPLEGEAVTGIDFALKQGVRISGTVATAGGIPLVDARVRAAHAAGWLHTRQTTTDQMGHYDLRGMLPGDFTVKAEADGFRDEWWDNVNHEDDADSFFADVEEHFSIDFELEPGQSPAYAWIESEPPGALIYLDYLATTNVTPARVNLGEAASQAPRAAPRAVSVKLDGYPYPAPMAIYPVEAETDDLEFDLDGISEVGEIEVITSPSGATVYVDYADVPIGVTPLVISNLSAVASSTHRLFVRKDGYLVPAPIDVEMHTSPFITVDIPLQADTEPALVADLISYPSGAEVFINAILSTNVTNTRIDQLDPAQHEGDGWWSAEHSVLLIREGYLRPLPRYIDFDDEEDQVIVVHLIPDEAYWMLFADPELARYEDWANAYGGTNVIGGASDDPFGKGLSNKEQMLAGLDPTDPDSRFEFVEWMPPSEGGIRIEWPSVPGKRYLVQCTANLQAAWQNITGIITATDTMTSVIHGTELEEGGRYYRVIVLP